MSTSDPTAPLTTKDVAARLPELLAERPMTHAEIIDALGTTPDRGRAAIKMAGCMVHHREAHGLTYWTLTPHKPAKPRTPVGTGRAEQPKPVERTNLPRFSSPCCGAVTIAPDLQPHRHRLCFTCEREFPAAATVVTPS